MFDECSIVVRAHLNSNKNHQQHYEPTLNYNNPLRNNPPPNQKAVIPIEELIELADELVNWLVTDEESQDLLFDTPPIFDEYPDDEDVNTLTDEPLIKLEPFENFSNFHEDYVHDLLMLLSNLANVLFMEVRDNFLLQTKTFVFDQQCGLVVKNLSSNLANVLSTEEHSYIYHKI